MTAVRITSDGTPNGTKVLIDGKEARNVTAVEWGLDVNDLVATAAVTFVDVEVDVTGEVTL